MTTLSEALAPKSDQLNADDLIPGPRVLKITGARVSSEDRQKRMVLSYEGDQGKPWKPCKTMGRAMVMAWAITDEGYEAQLVGKSVRVYRDPEVRFGDQGQVGGIRISHMSHIDKPVSLKLTVSQGKKSVFTFHPLVTGAVPELTLDQARADLEFAATLDELKTAWSRKAMGPFRAELQADLDARKAALAEPETGRTDDQHGESHTTTDIAQKLIARLKLAKSLPGVDALETEYTEAAKPMLDPADQELVEIEIEAARAQSTPKS